MPHDRWNFSAVDVHSTEGLTEAYCLLSGYVNSEVFGFGIPSDCFCHMKDEEGLVPLNFSYDQTVYDFIVSAVNAKVEQEQAKQLKVPGSPYAIRNRCDCPKYDNAERTPKQGWIVTLTCPLHGLDGTVPLVRRPWK
jgi:hypothetical protein